MFTGNTGRGLFLDVSANDDLVEGNTFGITADGLHETAEGGTGSAFNQTADITVLGTADNHRRHRRRERGATLITAPADPGVAVGALGAFQRRNFALARAAAQAYLGELDEDALRAAAAAVRVPGRLQKVAERPATYLDGAHNPDGIRALAESLPELQQSGRTIAVVSILDDKDATAMLVTLRDAGVDGFVFTKTRNPRALSPATLESLEHQLHGPDAEIVADPQRALTRARELAGADGVVIATGSIYLVADMLDTGLRRRASSL